MKSQNERRMQTLQKVFKNDAKIVKELKVWSLKIKILKK